MYYYSVIGKKNKKNFTLSPVLIMVMIFTNFEP